MKLKTAEGHLDFLTDDDRLAGRYVYDDPFKPYIHPLNTPNGYTLSLCSPHDHKHHKALMYALSTRDVNFWEESPTTDDETVGREVHQEFTSVTLEGERVGFEEKLIWETEKGDLRTFTETRNVECAISRDSYGFIWTWNTHLQALRDTELAMSRWSARDERGNLVNYHGLGIRFRREFGCMGGNKLILDGIETAFKDGMGTVPEEATFQGSIDGIWPVPKCQVSFEQSQQNSLFVMDSPFAFMSFGPSNSAPKQLMRGEKILERYVVKVYNCNISS